MLHDESYDTALAIIGMSGRFPGARTLEEFWQNISGGVKSIRFFSEEELLAASVDPADLRQPNYVKAGGVLDGIDLFDAGFFGYTPRDAETMDPQHRFLLECCWEALEDAAYAPEAYSGLIGVFAGSAMSSYMLNNLYSNPEILQSIPKAQVTIGNDQDSLTTMVSYKFNLKGPSVAVQTFCSTSLVAVHLACQSLLSYESDIALAGGVAISVPQESGYFYEEGGILSPDGECRTFDAQGRGSVMGNGVGIVALKRLNEALKDGDHIYAVVRGSALNNDGGLRVSYTGPGLDGQKGVVAEALSNAGVEAEDISYIEAHGTATELGDAVELAALIKAFDSNTQEKGFCALGSVKPNVGHLDRAAGVTGLIKTVLALQHRQIPPSLNFERTNANIDLENSPFYINTELKAWTANGGPRRAGVSSFGVGGTNVHVVLEDAPEIEAASTSHPRPYHLLTLSARTLAALDAATTRLAAHLKQRPELDIADVAYTLQVGRTVFNHRRILVCQDREDALNVLGSVDVKRVTTTADPFRGRNVAFLFPGLGEQYVELARALYQAEPDFRDAVEHCCSFLKVHLDLDLYEVFSPADRDNTGKPSAQPGLDFRALVRRNGHETPSAFLQTAIAQPAVFVFEYALTQLLHQWGIHPCAMLGYSLGEYVAACVGGVLTLENALMLVARRARLIQNASRGAMLAVNLAEDAIRPYLSERVSLAAVNSPITCVLAGPDEAIELLEQRFAQQEIVCYRVASIHAFHSTMLDPLREALNEIAHSMEFMPPQIPYISNVTGDWITAEQATDPTYWARHMCQTVQFAAGVQQLLQDPEWLVLEVGPGQALSSFVKQHPACGKNRMPMVQALLPASYERQACHAYLLNALGKLWQAGVTIDWSGFHTHEPRRRVSLPAYPFERQRYWIAPGAKKQGSASSNHLLSVSHLERLPDIADWCYLSSWKRGVSYPPFSSGDFQASKRCWLVFVDSCGIGDRMLAFLQQHEQEAIAVRPGPGIMRQHERAYIVKPDCRADYEALMQSLYKEGKVPTDVVHLWAVTAQGSSTDEACMEYGFYSLLALAQSLGGMDQQDCTISIVSNETQEVMDGEALCPAKATVMGPCRVIPQEYAHLKCRSIDITLPENDEKEEEALLIQLMGELTCDVKNIVVALRGNRRWFEAFEPIKLQATAKSHLQLRQDGTYLVTGGLGGIGLAMAEHLACSYRANLILTSRSGLPPREQWERIQLEQGDTQGPGRQISAILRMEEQGSSVLVMAADVSNEQQMDAVFQQALARFGVIHGVLHAAGAPGVGLMQFKTAEIAAQVLAPKVKGVHVLEQLLRKHAPGLDFLALFSSMSSITGGGPGQVDYCAANTFLDVYARKNHALHGKTVAIGWGEWQWNGWESGLAGYDAATQDLFRAHRQHYGITFEEGIDAFTRIIASDLPHVVVSTQEFCAFAELSKSFTAATVLQYERTQQQAQEKYARPELSSSYIAPGTDLERQIGAVWEEFLGVASIGINDNFFELGGNSLTGVALMARIKRELKDDRLAAHVLYEAPSVGSLARYVLQTQGEVQQEVWDERSEKRRSGLRQRIHETQHTR